MTDVQVHVAGPDDWAAAYAPVLLLEVHEANPRAITAYARLGFVDTGQRRAYPLEPGGLEIVMALGPPAP